MSIPTHLNDEIQIILIQNPSIIPSVIPAYESQRDYLVAGIYTQPKKYLKERLNFSPGFRSQSEPFESFVGMILGDKVILN